MYHVACQRCGAWVMVRGGPCACEDGHPGLGEGQLCAGQFHEALDAAGTCQCCPEDHSHRLATIETNQPCRPIHIVAMAGSAIVSVV